MSGVSSFRDIGARLGYTSKKGYPGYFESWVALYRVDGESAFYKLAGNRSYTKEFKMMVVEEYLHGSGSLVDLCIKYHISSDSILRRWISLYNAYRKLMDYNPKRDVYMAEARRKTSIEERKKIVTYCIEHNRDYKSTAALYDVSYSQLYSWVKKYDATGEDGLTDKRSRHKTEDEVDELERLRRENLPSNASLRKKIWWLNC